MNKRILWQKIMDENPDSKLIFIHTPKCGGSYVSKILKDLNISKKGHHQAIKNEGINFTVIRDPIDRFQSLLNYRLGHPAPRKDWPTHLEYVYNDKSVTLNKLVAKMTDDEILGFRPYSTLTVWTTNVDIIITIDQLPELLDCFGYQYDEKSYPQINMSVKERGSFNNKTRNRLANLFKDDILLFNNVKHSAL
jgi:hypothetical protein